NVDFTVQVPAGVRFTGRNVNGNVEATDLAGPSVVTSVNGDVAVSTSSRAEASTVNGNVRAAVGRADWTGPAEFHTVNGDVTVVLPSSASTEVTASTVNGDIATDFP